jgi:hypothetical protein
VLANSFLLVASLLGQPFAEGQCGADRWSVKLGADPDAQNISSVIVDTSIKALGRIPIPEIPYPANARIAPQELTRYRLTGVILQKRKEGDGDLHVVLQDPNDSSRMIVELPRDDCATASRFRKDILAARIVLQSARVGTRIQVVGIGFFDFIHEAFGAAPNSFELHPVIFATPLTPGFNLWRDSSPFK